MTPTVLPRQLSLPEALDRIERALNALERQPLLNGNIIPVTFTAAYPAAVRVYHGLGRAPKGYYVINTGGNAFGLLTEVPPANEPDPANYITLAFGSAASTLIVVF